MWPWWDNLTTTWKLGTVHWYGAKREHRALQYWLSVKRILPWQEAKAFCKPRPVGDIPPEPRISTPNACVFAWTLARMLIEAPAWRPEENLLQRSSRLACNLPILGARAKWWPYWLLFWCSSWDDVLEATAQYRLPLVVASYRGFAKPLVYWGQWPIGVPVGCWPTISCWLLWNEQLGALYRVFAFPLSTAPLGGLWNFAEDIQDELQSGSCFCYGFWPEAPSAAVGSTTTRKTTFYCRWHDPRPAAVSSCDST